MANTTDVRPVYFKTPELAALMQTSVTRIQQLMTKGRLKPAVPGGGGPPHLFSAQQALALLAIRAINGSSRRCTPAYTRQILGWFDTMPDRMVWRWAGVLANDPHGEEEFAKWNLGLDALVGDEPREPWEDNDERRAVAAEIRAGWARVEAAIREKVGAPAQRPIPAPIPQNRVVNEKAGKPKKPAARK